MKLLQWKLWPIQHHSGGQLLYKAACQSNAEDFCFFCCSHSNLCFMYLIIIIDVIPAPQFWFWNTLRTTIWATRLWRWQILVWLGSGIEPRRWAQRERMPGWPLRSSAPQLSPRAVMFGGGHQEMCVSVCVCDLATPKASHSTLQPSWQVFRISYYPCVTLLKKNKYVGKILQKWF